MFDKAENTWRRWSRPVLLTVMVVIGVLLYSAAANAWHRRVQVIQWLNDCPKVAHRGPSPGWKWDEWGLAGRRIYGSEDIVREMYDWRRTLYRGILKNVPASLLLESIAFVGTDSSVPWLISIVEDFRIDDETKSSAMGALGMIGDPRAIQLSKRILGTSSGSSSARVYSKRLKFMAIGMLAWRGDVDSMPLIEAQLNVADFANDIDRRRIKERIFELKTRSNIPEWDRHAVEAIRVCIAQFVGEHSQREPDMLELNLGVAELNGPCSQEGDGYWRVGRWTIAKGEGGYWEASIENGSPPGEVIVLRLELVMQDTGARVNEWSIRHITRRSTEK